MKLGFVHEDGAGGVKFAFCDVGEHDLNEDEGFCYAVEEACAALGWTRPEWDFRHPVFEEMEWCKLILCRLKDSTAVLPGFMNPV
jgi:hypothetical protein